MKLLFFASDYNIGLSSLLTDQLQAINENTELQVIGIAGEREQVAGLDNRLQKTGISVKRVIGLDEHKDFFRLTNELKNIINEKGIELVHVQNNWQLILVACIKVLSSSFNRIKVIYTIHGYRHNHYFKSIVARFVIGTLLLVFADKIICMSNHVHDKFRLLSYKMAIIYLGVSDSFFEKKVNDINTTQLSLIFPGQFRHGKNQDLIIEAFHEYVRITHDKHAVLCLPGEGELLPYCKMLAQDIGLSNQIIFPGHKNKEDIRKLYEESNIAVVSSNSETFGQSIVEPFVLGRCIFTRKVGVAPDIIEEGVNGYFFKSKEDLINLIITISKDKSQIENIGNNNFTKRDTFAWSSIAAAYSRFILSQPA